VFTGREYDQETGTYFYRARYYHAVLGRFLSRDDAGYPAGQNLYQLVDSRCVEFVDPWGLLAQVGFWSGINSNGTNYINYWNLGVPGNPQLGGTSDLNTLSTGPWPFAQPNLNREAQSFPSNLPNLCPGPTKIAILMVEPATTAGSPDNPCHCCKTDMTLLFNPGDKAVAVAGIPNDLPDRQRQVAGSGTAIPVWLGGFLGHDPDPGELSNLPILQRTYLQPTRFKPVNIGYTPTGKTFDVRSWLLSQYLGSSEGTPDYVFVCHSQGCNLLLESLKKSCN
jgi:RHS repeat-associated protein